MPAASLRVAAIPQIPISVAQAPSFSAVWYSASAIFYSNQWTVTDFRPIAMLSISASEGLPGS